MKKLIDILLVIILLSFSLIGFFSFHHMKEDNLDCPVSMVNDECPGIKDINGITHHTNSLLDVFNSFVSKLTKLIGLALSTTLAFELLLKSKEIYKVFSFNVLQTKSFKKKIRWLVLQHYESSN